MISASLASGKMLVEEFEKRESIDVQRKGPADFVSEADLRSEAIIGEILSEAFPEYGIMTEEGSDVAGMDKNNCFIVDPLDGTTNFLHGMQQFCVSIALERNGEPYAGVVYAPMLNELFFAELDCGAYCNSQPIKVSTCTDLSTSLIGCGLPFKGEDNRELVLQEADKLLAETAGLRRFGAAAYDLCMTAAGRLDAHWERGLYPWDAAAGIVIIREAGGKVTSIGPDQSAPHMSGQLLASNDFLHSKITNLLMDIESL
jgi:myo-inositol-1(or 4)-monophosphatase